MGSYHRRKSAAKWSSITKCLTPPEVVFITFWVSLMTYNRFFSLYTRKYTAGDKLGKKVKFWRTWFSSPTSQVCTMAAEWTTNSEPFRQLFPQAQVLIQKTKNSVNRTWWACTRTFPVARHPSQLTDGDSGDEILDSLNFLWNCRWLCSSVFLQALMVQIMRFVVYLWRNLTPKAWSVINIFFAEAFFGLDLPSNEISDSSYSSDFGGGKGCRLISGQPSFNQHEQRKKTFLQKLSIIHRSKESIKSPDLSHKPGRHYRSCRIWFWLHLVFAVLFLNLFFIIYL